MTHTRGCGMSVAAAVAMLVAVVAATAATGAATAVAAPAAATSSEAAITSTTATFATPYTTPAVRYVSAEDVKAALQASEAVGPRRQPTSWSRTPVVNARVLRVHLEKALRHVPFTNVAAVARSWLRATAAFPVHGGKVGDFYNVILVNATNPATRDFYGIAASEVYEPRPLKQPVKLVIFRGGRYVNRGRGGVTNVAFLGCHPGSSAAARAVTFVPPEQCARGKGKGGGGR